LIAAQADEGERAGHYLQNGIADARREGNLPELAWSLHYYAEYLVHQGEGDNQERVRALLNEAESVASDLGMRPLSARIAALATGEEDRAAGRRVERLTRRESEVLGQIALGKTNQEISRDLCISEHTVAHHVSAILRKIGLTNRVDAAVYAAQHGIRPEQ
jgi:DNA-binding NarL/FixJ family response regulator